MHLALTNNRTKGAKLVQASGFLALSMCCLSSCFAQASTIVAPAPREDEGNAKATWTSVTSAPSPKLTGLSDVDADTNTGFGKHQAKRLLNDQKAIWTSPAHMSWADVDLMVPWGMATGLLLATDTHNSKYLSHHDFLMSQSQSVSFSNYGLGAMVGLGGGLYVWGKITHDDHKKETGFLAGEAAVNSFLVASAFKYSLGRDRPQDSPKFQGNFFSGGTSMPSEHAAISWAIASVVAHEYPGPLTSYLAYGLASAVSIARVTGQQHFPSDVLIGSLVGWYIGKQAYRAHHDAELGGGEWGSYGEFTNGQPNERTTSLGTTLVPLDSWIYPALERLIALGYVRNEFMGTRPWSRFECVSLVLDAGERVADGAEVTPEVQGLYAALLAEFAADTERAGGGRPVDSYARLESAYTRMTGIAGPTLHDGYHFGETIYNDFGRPYGEGVNFIAGTSGWVSKGRFAVYVRGEYQYAPASPTYSPTVNSTIAQVDENPLQAGTFPSTSRLNVLDAYISSTQSNWLMTFGKQSLWWGPDYGSDLMFSNNAEPMYLFRVSRIQPFEIPWISKVLGPMKVDFFYGKFAGNQFPAGAQLHGEKISFKPYPDLEVGFTRTGELGGEGRPLTLHRLWESYTSVTTVVNETPYSDPGKRTSGFDFSWRPPYIRNWITFYGNTLASDNTSPLADIERAAINPGIYLSHFPWVSKLDLRLEAVYTSMPNADLPDGHFNYWDIFYHDLYTNNGNLIGSWIGRQGKGYQAWSTYHFSSRDWLQLGYRHANISPGFIPQGGTITDGSVSVNTWLKKDVNLTAMLQYERWCFPLLATGPQTNWTSSIGINFYPGNWSVSSRSGPGRTE